MWPWTLNTHMHTSNSPVLSYHKGELRPKVSVVSRVWSSHKQLQQLSPLSIGQPLTTSCFVAHCQRSHGVPMQQKKKVSQPRSMYSSSISPWMQFILLELFLRITSHKPITAENSVCIWLPAALLGTTFKIAGQHKYHTATRKRTEVTLNTVNTVTAAPSQSDLLH